MTCARDFIEATFVKLAGFEKPTYFEFPQETTFQAFHPFSSEGENIIPDWKRFLCIYNLERQVFYLDSQTITYNTFTNPLASVKFKEDSSQLEKFGFFETFDPKSSLYIPLTNKTKIPISF